MADVQSNKCNRRNNKKSPLTPNLTGQNPFNDIERDLLALPARLGGLGIFDPCKKCVTVFCV